METRAVRLTFSDGSDVTVIPHESRTCEISVDSLAILVAFNGDDFSVATTSHKDVAPSVSLLSAAIVKSESPTKLSEGAEKIDGPGIQRTCITCNGKYYCATNGCMNTPCGWVCG